MPITQTYGFTGEYAEMRDPMDLRKEKITMVRCWYRTRSRFVVHHYLNSNSEVLVALLVEEWGRTEGMLSLVMPQGFGRNGLSLHVNPRP